MAAGVGSALGGGVPQNYDDWVQFHRRNGTLPKPSEMKPRYETFAKNHGIVTPAARTAQEAAQSEARKQAALTKQPSAVNFNTETPEFKALNAQNLAELRRYAGVEQTGPDQWDVTGTGELQRNAQEVVSQNAINRAQLALSLRNQLQGANRNAAARGLGITSGILRNNRQNYTSAADIQTAQYDAADTRANNAVSTGVADAITTYYLSTFGPEGRSKADSVIAALKAKGIIS